MYQYRCDTCGRNLVSNVELKDRKAICNKIHRERQKGGRIRKTVCRGVLQPLSGGSLADQSEKRESHYAAMNASKVEAARVKKQAKAKIKALKAKAPVSADVKTD